MKWVRDLFILACVVIAMPGNTQAEVTSVTANRQAERTCFQSWAPYSREIDIRSDVAIVYGQSPDLPARMQLWRDNGYVTHFMTGAAWGGYADYIEGRFDSVLHKNEGQVDAKGDVIWHDPNTVPYMVPTPAYVKYLISLGKKAIDAGAEALHYEEPEFWARAGYSDGFKQMWASEYKTPWQRPDSSPDAFWRSSKLKYVLYKRALEQVFAECKVYGRSKGRDIQCFVPTHSLVNYAQWGIVSPESSLMELANCDGYIAQVWTGTARSPNVYRGTTRERTFETAFLEYSSMYHMVAPTGKKVFFLADPVEDDPNHTWDDYIQNYQRVLVASLLFPEVSSFEVMPWPDRVMTGKYPAGSYGEPGSKASIPVSYATSLMTSVNALNDMHQPEWSWLHAGSQNVGVLASDTMMFQRGSPWVTDHRFSNFYGLGVPLIKAGIPPRVVVAERVREPEALRDIHVLLMTYEGMKPLRREYNTALADWVRGGGVLLYFGDDSDPFHKVNEWWERSGNPRIDLFRQCSIPTNSGPGFYRVGRGAVGYMQQTPASLAASPSGADVILSSTREALRTLEQPMAQGNSLVLQRGPYVIGYVLEESVSSEPVRLHGLYVDLFSSSATMLQHPVFNAGDAFLLRRIDSSHPEATVLACSGRVERADYMSGEAKLVVRAPVAVTNVVLRVSLPSKPKAVHGATRWEWSGESHTLLIYASNDGKTAAAEVTIRY